MLLVLIVVIGVLGAVVALGYRNAVADPVARRAAFKLPSWPVGQPPLKVALLSDVHAGNLGMDSARLTRIVAQVNAAHPDLVLIAGDFLTRADPIDAPTATRELAPLKGLTAPLGVLAVPGNHDHWTGLAAVRTALAAANVTLAANQIVRRGPLVIGAIDDAYSGHARTAEVAAAMRSEPGPRLALTHSPDVAKELPRNIPLLLAGHTHCGQVVVPGYGSVGWVRYYDPQYQCGLIKRGRSVIVVTGGLGGSLPLRFGAPPDWWLLTLGP